MARAQQQDYRTLVHFLTEDVWNALRDRERSQLAKVDVLCRYLVETLGLRYPSEPTFASVAAVAQCFVNAGNDLTSLLGTCKSVMKTTTVRAQQASRALPAEEYIVVLPVAPSGFSVGLQQHFNQNNVVFSAVPEGISAEVVMQTAASIPLRSTHRSIQLQKKIQEQQSMGAFGLAAALPQLQMAQAMMMGSFFPAANTERGLQNLQIFGNSKERAASSRGNTLAELMDRAEQPPAVASQPAESAVPLLALQDKPAGSSESLTKPESAALGVPPDRKESTDVEPTNVDDSVSPKAKEPSVATEVAEALAMAHYNKELPADDGKGSGLRRPAARKAQMKKPAASLKVAVTAKTAGPSLKKPAAASKRVASKMAGSVVQRKGSEKKTKVLKPLSERQRMKLRPQGCGRCRERPGCCRSCWVLRGYEVSQ